MIFLTGAISYSMYEKHMELKEILFPLLKCHLQKMTIVKISKRDDSNFAEKSSLTLCVPTRSFHVPFLRCELLKNMAENDREIGLLKCAELNIKESSFTIPMQLPVSIIVKISQGFACSDVSGVAWSTCQADQSNEEYWLAAEKSDISHFLMSFCAEKKLVKKGDIISYHGNKYSDNVFQGQLEIGDLTYRFLKISNIDNDLRCNNDDSSKVVK